MYNHRCKRGSPRAVVVNVLTCDIIVKEFKSMQYYYINFQNNTYVKGMNHIIFPSSNGLNNTTIVLQRGFSIK